MSRFLRDSHVKPDVLGPVHWDDPLLRGISFLYIDRDEDPVDEVTGTKLTKVSLPTRQSTPYGTSWKNTSTNDGFYTPYNMVATSTDYTMFCSVYFDQTVSWSYFLGLNNKGGLAIRSTGDKPYFRMGSNLEAPNNTFVHGRRYTLVGVVRGSNKYLYVNGEQVASTTKDNTPTSVAMCLFTYTTGGSFSENDGRGMFNGGYINSRAWSDAEIREYEANNHRFAEIRPRLRLVPSSGTPPPVLTLPTESALSQTTATIGCTTDTA